jgi:hypothetical protein
MIKRSTLAMAIAIAAPLALATAEQAAAAPALSSSSALKSSSASVVTDVQYVYDFGSYGYRPVYKGIVPIDVEIGGAALLALSR